jgi:hypothetical protein
MAREFEVGVGVNPIKYLLTADEARDTAGCA